MMNGSLIGNITRVQLAWRLEPKAKFMLEKGLGIWDLLITLVIILTQDRFFIGITGIHVWYVIVWKYQMPKFWSAIEFCQY